MGDIRRSCSQTEDPKMIFKIIEFYAEKIIKLYSDQIINRIDIILAMLRNIFFLLYNYEEFNICEIIDRFMNAIIITAKFSNLVKLQDTINKELKISKIKIDSLSGNDNRTKELYESYIRILERNLEQIQIRMRNLQKTVDIYDKVLTDKDQLSNLQYILFINKLVYDIANRLSMNDINSIIINNLSDFDNAALLDIMGFISEIRYIFDHNAILKELNNYKSTLRDNSNISNYIRLDYVNKAIDKLSSTVYNNTKSLQYAAGYLLGIYEILNIIDNGFKYNDSLHDITKSLNNYTDGDINTIHSAVENYYNISQNNITSDSLNNSIIVLTKNMNKCYTWAKIAYSAAITGYVEYYMSSQDIDSINKAIDTLNDCVRILTDHNNGSVIQNIVNTAICRLEYKINNMPSN